MLNHIKNILVVFLISSIIGVGLLYLSFKLPNNSINTNAQESAWVFQKEGLYKQNISGYENSTLDNYTDALIINESIYNGKESSLRKAMKVYNYSGKKDPIEDLSAAIDGDKIKTSSYGRYWHGNVVITRLALTFFNYTNIKIINLFLQVLLLLYIIMLLIKRNLNIYIFPFIVSVFMIFPFIIGLSLQFSPVYYISLISSIIILKYNEKIKERKLYFYLFLLIGIFTSYFDLLTFPLMSLGIPLLFYLLLNNDNLKSILKIIVVFSFAWALGYFGMWFLKWIIGSICCNENFFRDAFSATKYRLTTDAGRFAAIKKNVLVYSRQAYLAIIISVIIYYSVHFLRNKYKISKKQLLNLVPYFLIFFMPLVWYFLLSQHSIVHYWFTNKALIISFFALFIIMAKISYNIKK